MGYHTMRRALALGYDLESEHKVICGLSDPGRTDLLSVAPLNAGIGARIRSYRASMGLPRGSNPFVLVNKLRLSH